MTDFHILRQADALLYGADTRKNAVKALRYVEARMSSTDIVILGGDLSHDSSAESYAYLQDQLNSLPATYQCVPGNHDTSDEVESFIGPLPRVLRLTHKWNLILLDSRVTGQEYGQVTAASLELISRELNGSSGHHLITLHHDVFQPECPNRPGLRVNQNRLIQMLVTYTSGVILVISGHRHQYARMTMGHLTLVNSGAVSVQLDFSSDRPTATSTAPELLGITLNDKGDANVIRHVLTGDGK